MLKRWIASLASVLVGAGVALAQAPEETTPPSIGETVAGATSVNAPNSVLSGPVESSDSRFWFRAEYLLWRVRSAPISNPLITSNPDPTTIAALNNPGTTILYGAGSGQDTGFGWFSGMRFTLGGWADDCQQFGWEANGFVLERRSNLFEASTAGGAARVLGIPFIATEPFGINPVGETTLNSAGVPAVFSTHLNTRFWGLEANGLANLFRTDSLQVSGLIGFRYLDLVENLTLNATLADNATQGVVSITDGFGTRNQFYGGQVGLRAAINRGRWSVDTTAKIAFGSTHQVLNIVGVSEVTQGALGFPTGVTPVGGYGEPSNIGTHTRNVFAVVPEVQVTLAFQLTQNLRPFIGYNFLYLSNAIRPGEQMDRNVNLTQNPFAVGPGVPVTGQPAPLPTFRSGDFWAQGLNFGMELRY